MITSIKKKKQPTSLIKESNAFSWLPVLIESTVDNEAETSQRTKSKQPLPFSLCIKIKET